MTTIRHRADADRGAWTDMSEVRERFGGGDIVAAVLGMLAALGSLVFLGALIAAGNASISYQPNLVDIDGNLDAIDVVGSVVALGVVFVAFLVGGFAAGRIARYDGGLNGFGSGLLFVLLVAVFAGLGTWVGTEYNAFAGAELPNWIAQLDANDLTLKAGAAAIGGVVAACLGGYVGGLAGESFHRRADAVVAREAARS